MPEDGGTRTTPASPGATGPRRARWVTSACSPRCRHSIAVKKPLIRKKTGIRNPWIAVTRMAYGVPSPSTDASLTAHAPGMNASAPCSTMPSNIANARSASRSCRRSMLPAVCSVFVMSRHQMAGGF